MSGFSLDHLAEERVDLVLTVAEVTTLNEVGGLLAPSTGRGVQLEGPQVVGGVLEVGANGEDLVNKVFDADDVELAKLLLDEVVGGDWGASTIDLGEASLVDQLADTLQVGGTPSNVRLCKVRR